MPKTALVPRVSPVANFAATTLLFFLLGLAQHVWFPTLFALSGLVAGWVGAGVLCVAELRGFRWRSATVGQRALVVASMLVGIGLGGALSAAVGVK